ncbi:GntR family transcriptional regulator [Streptomyces sp. NPDC005202]|uniref:GntR family transcriptional regulator n=1 Tax=Streptomyces sp. NPDC005202 TaxID=3157021 RepID=UPI0033A94E57
MAEDVQRRLLEQIRQGELTPGQRLGSERHLAAELGVSRSTLRQALGVLENEGVVRRVPGRGGGTFVSDALGDDRGKVERDLSTVVGVPAYLRSQGFTAGTRILGTAIRAADEATADALGLTSEALVLEVVRIRLADGIPISLERAQLPADQFPGLLEMPLGGSLYELLEDRFGVVPDTAVERIEVVEASADQARILGVEAGAPLLSIERTTSTGDGKPFEFSHDLFRADRTRIVVHTDEAGRGSGSPRSQGHRVEMKRGGAS